MGLHRKGAQVGGAGVQPPLLLWVRLRGLAESPERLADDIDGAALLLGERLNESAAEVTKVRQIATLFKELG